MNINSEPGTMVKYLGTTDDQVRWASHDDPRGFLNIGQLYVVDHIDIHSWHSEVYLVGFEDKDFNSVCFEEVKEDKNGREEQSKLRTVRINDSGAVR